MKRAHIITKRINYYGNDKEHVRCAVNRQKKHVNCASNKTIYDVNMTNANKQ